MMIFIEDFASFCLRYAERGRNARIYAESARMQGARLECKRMCKDNEDAKDGTGKNALQGEGQSTDSIS